MVMKTFCEIGGATKSYQATNPNIEITSTLPGALGVDREISKVYTFRKPDMSSRFPFVPYRIL